MGKYLIRSLGNFWKIKNGCSKIYSPLLRILSLSALHQGNLKEISSLYHCHHLRQYLYPRLNDTNCLNLPSLHICWLEDIVFGYEKNCLSMLLNVCIFKCSILCLVCLTCGNITFWVKIKHHIPQQYLPLILSYHPGSRWIDICGSVGMQSHPRNRHPFQSVKETLRATADWVTVM